jgi:hypothetical protein
MGAIMKLSLILATMLMCQMSFGQSIKEKRIKKEMLDRVELLIEKVESTRDDLKKEDVDGACQKIKEIFAVYPDHLKAIGSHMDFDRARTVKAKDRALEQLIFMHKQSNICDQGCDHENVDPKELRKELKGIERSLKKQRRVIKRSDTSLENSFYYHYEF